MNIDDEMRCTDHQVTFMPACEKCGVSLEDVVTSTRRGRGAHGACCVQGDHGGWRCGVSDVRELLDGIEVQVDHHPWVDGQWHVHEAAHGMLGALRAVQDLHTECRMTERIIICHDCQDKWPCPTVRAITDALGGGA